MFASLTPKVTEGAKHCRRVDLGSKWRAPVGADARTADQFRSGYGDLAFRLDERDTTHVLVAFTAKQYSPYRVIYSVNKYRLPVVPQARVEPASDMDWDRATPLAVDAGTPYESAPPYVDPGGVLWRGDVFPNRKPFRSTTPYLTSPDGNWIAVQSWEGRVPWCDDFVCDGSIAKGTVALDVYRAATLQRAVAIDVAFLFDLPDTVIENSRWISDRHFVFPLNIQQTHLMICDLGGFYQDQKPAWNRGNAAEILGILDEGVAEPRSSEIRAIRLNTTVRVPEPGTYYLKTTVEDPQGTRAPSEGWRRTFEEAGIHRLEFLADIGRLEANAPLVIRQASLVQKLQHGERAVAELRQPVRLASYNFVARPNMKTRPSPPLPTIRLLLPVLQTTAVDNDHNGKFEYLRARATLDLPGGSCNWTASLLDQSGTIIAFAGGQDELVRGEQSLDFYLDGGHIAGKGRDGPYQVAGVTIECTQRDQRYALLNATQLKSTTAAFHAAQFEHVNQRPYWRFTASTR